MPHAETAAHVDHFGRPAQLVAAARGEAGEQLDREQVRVRVRELRADVDVQPLDGEPGFARPPDRFERVVCIEPELRPEVSRADRLVRLCVDAGRDAHEHASHPGLRCAQRLLERVEHDERVELGGGAQLLVRLVVAVEDDPLTTEARASRELELAERGHVRAQAFLGEQAQHCDVREGFRPVDDERARGRLDEQPRALAQRLLAVDDERRSEALHERRCRDAAEEELALLDAGRRREQC